MYWKFKSAVSLRNNTCNSIGFCSFQTVTINCMLELCTKSWSLMPDRSSIKIQINIHKIWRWSRTVGSGKVQLFRDNEAEKAQTLRENTGDEFLHRAVAKGMHMMLFILKLGSYFEVFMGMWKSPLFAYLHSESYTRSLRLNSSWFLIIRIVLFWLLLEKGKVWHPFSSEYCNQCRSALFSSI